MPRFAAMSSLAAYVAASSSSQHTTIGSQFGSRSSHVGRASRKWASRPRQVVTIHLRTGAIGELMGQYEALYHHRTGQTTPNEPTGLTFADDGHPERDQGGPP